MSARPTATTSRCWRPTWSSSSASRSSPSPPAPATRPAAPRRWRSSSTRSCRRSWMPRRPCRRASLVTDPLTLRRGDAKAAIAAAPRRLSGRMRIGGQEHFYLEGQIALAVPGEDDEVTVYSSTQHPSEIQHMVAKVLDVASHAVTVEIRRMGGALRRQGDPRQPVRLHLRHRRQEDRPRRQGPPRPRRRHGRHRQAARFRRRLRGRLRR